MRGRAGLAIKSPLPDMARRRFVINVGSNLGYLVLNTALMLWYIPFLIRHLGLAAYGMIPLANSLVMYAGIISTGLDTSIIRFLAIDLNQGNDAAANRTFNTALALSLAACGILVLPAGVVIYCFPVLFQVPSGLALATQVLFASVGITTLAAILSGNFGVASAITHRFDLRNLVRSATAVSRVGVIVLCFFIWPPSLWSVAGGFIVSACIGLAGDVLVWRRLAPQLHVNWRAVDRHRFGVFIGLSSWVTVSQIGFLLLSQVDLLIVNALFGAETTGRYGSVLLFPTLINTMIGTITTVLGPAIIGRYAVGDIEGLRRITVRSVKLIGIGLALPIGLLGGFGGPLLNLWLGSEFIALDLLLVLLTGHLSVNLAIMPVVYVLTAYNRVKLQGLATLALGIMDVVLAIALARWGGLGAVGVAAAGAIIWTVRNTGFLSSYSAFIMGLPWWIFYPPLAIGALGTLSVAAAGRLISQLWWPSSWLTLGTTGAAIGAVYTVLAYAFGLNHSDRDLLWSLMRRKPHM